MHYNGARVLSRKTFPSQLYVFPSSTILFEACYGLTLGSLGT